MGMTEAFQHKGHQWMRHFAPSPTQAFILGCDLGQSQDPTAIIIIMHHVRTPLDSWTVNEVAHTIRQDLEEYFDVVYAERLPLGTSYPDIVSYVGELLSRPPLRDGCHLVVDESGVGRAVGDMFDAAELKPVRISITAGADATKLNRPRCWSFSKALLTSGVDARLHSGELRFAAELTEAHVLAEELKDFRRHLTSAGRATYQARTGKHDDLVLAVAIALWWTVERRKHQIYIGPLRGLC